MNRGSSMVDKKEEFQKKLAQFQMLQANMQALQEREHVIAQRFAELQETKQTIDELKTVKNNDETLIPLGTGNFISGKVLDSENVLVGLGAGVAIRKSREEAKKILDSRIQEMQNVVQDMSLQMQAITQEMQKLQPEIERLQAESQ